MKQTLLTICLIVFALPVSCKTIISEPMKRAGIYFLVTAALDENKGQSQLFDDLNCTRLCVY